MAGRPIVEQILGKVRERLLVITEGPKFADTVVGVERPTRISTLQPKHYQVVLGQSVKRNAALSTPGNPPGIAWDLTVEITCTLRPSESDPCPIDTFRNEFWADAVIAITNHPDWHNWDGLALISTLGDPIDGENDAGDAGVMVPLVITYRVSENDPTKLR